MPRSIRTTVAVVTAVAALAAAGTASAAPKVAEDPLAPAFAINVQLEAKRAPKPSQRRVRFTNIRANASGLGTAMRL
jgi:hypothetical protein